MSTKKPIPCFGVSCSVHQNCRAYMAVEYSDPRELRMDRCPHDKAGRPLMYTPIVVHVERKEFAHA